MPGYNYEVVKNTDGTINCFRFASSREGIRYFVDNYGKALAQALAGSGIFLATAIAQKTRESAYGTHRFARQYNNFGGIMNPSGKTPYANGRISISGNRILATFASPEDCFKSYVATLLSPSKRYISSGLLTAKTPKEQMLAIAKGGYCTDPAPNIYYENIVPTIALCLDMFSTGKIKIS